MSESTYTVHVFIYLLVIESLVNFFLNTHTMHPFPLHIFFSKHPFQFTQTRYGDGALVFWPPRSE